MKKYSKQSLERRKEERKDFPDFFQKHIQNIKDNRLCCEECGARLSGNTSEVAHILPKQTFKSVSINDDNVIYLCGMYSENQCHHKFDNWSTEEIKKMKIFDKICESFENLLPLLTERINYKITDRYTK